MVLLERNTMKKYRLETDSILREVFIKCCPLCHQRLRHSEINKDNYYCLNNECEINEIELK